MCFCTQQGASVGSSTCLSAHACCPTSPMLAHPAIKVELSNWAEGGPRAVEILLYALYRTNAHIPLSSRYLPYVAWALAVANSSLLPFYHFPGPIALELQYVNLGHLPSALVGKAWVLEHLRAFVYMSPLYTDSSFCCWDVRLSRCLG